MANRKQASADATQDGFKSELLNQAQALLAERLAGDQIAQAHYYAEAFLRRVPEEDLLETDAETLAAMVTGQMAFAAQRLPSETLIRVFNPGFKEDGWSSEHTIVELLNTDMPFIVDSCNLVMAELNLAVHIMVHPVIHVERDARGKALGFYSSTQERGKPESMVHMQVDRQSDPALLEAIEQRLAATMQDIRRAVHDWPLMNERVGEAIDKLPAWAQTADAALVSETAQFLAWIRDDHFIFLGSRDYRVNRDNDQLCLEVVEGSGLGLLQETDRTIYSRPAATLADGAQTVRDQPLIITKTRRRSTVHRAGYMDYLGVLQYDRQGRIIGERRFIGLFTSNAYFRRVLDTPLLRSKVAWVLEQSYLRKGSHASKSLMHIIETLPRDDLFQASATEISDIATAVLLLQERQRVRLLVRREQFSRFFSCLVYIPRDHFNTEARKQIQDILFKAYQGEQLDYNVQISQSVLARLQVIIRSRPGADPDPDVRALEGKIIEAVSSWHDGLREILVQKVGEEQGLAWAASIGRAFPAAYAEDVSPWVASFDVERIAALGDETDLKMSLYRPRKRDSALLRFKLFKRGQPIPLSEVLPILENLGLSVMNERPYVLELGADKRVWVQDYDMVYAQAANLSLEQVRDSFTEAFENIWRGVTRSDGLNRLILASRLHWRQVKMLRAYSRYLLQTGLPFSLDYMSATLARHPLLARLLVELFEAMFDPGRGAESDYRRDLESRHLKRDLEALVAGGEQDPVLAEYLRNCQQARLAGGREEQVAAMQKAYLRGLNAVRSIDEDRILHVFSSVVSCTLRTNYFQADAGGVGHEHLSFKLDSAEVPELPKPRPYREIWVYSPRVEGIHLRMGPIARGGLRWSDRKEDFRTEVLGLMKAQNVKNTIIVPVGAKGGFVPTQLSEAGGREEIMQEVVYCYKSFINGLLDITDNIHDEKIVPPKHVVRRDGDDPYLVVAADKGTATFSDTANAIALERGFWLGDAFASGGSVGYDHKAMGITAKGAWEGVKRHFRELGTDIQKQPFTVVGIGDMSGDVFGNGMLLSRHIRLKAAFNHQHIFIDPEPDEKAGFAERRRLFALPRSSWADYNSKLISAGGGIFSRQEKSIALSRQVRDWLGVSKPELTPNELIRAIMLAEYDLLWNGGIGTYVKAARESNSEVGDHANNALRVNGAELRCKVVGEGGNLGLTQLGRVEYAQSGGRLNTDFIDNSAGVDCSDHEVNIKILLDEALRAGQLQTAERSALLAGMTTDVEQLVLRSNYLQTQALSLMERLSAGRLGAKQRFISVLEQEQLLDRQLEGLPEDDELQDRQSRGEGLTRPELAVLLSYSKIRLYRQLLESDITEDAFLATELQRYFPAQLQERFSHLMPRHSLGKEIIATQVTNSLVNRMGITFVLRMREDTGASASDVARAYTVARELLEARDFWSRLEALDNKVSAAAQIDAQLLMWDELRRVTRWVANTGSHHLDIHEFLERLRPGFEAAQKQLTRNLDEQERERVGELERCYLEQGFPARLARRIALLPLLAPLLDVVETSVQQGLDIAGVARVYRGVGDSLRLKWLREQVERLRVSGQWHAQARGNLRDELFAHHRNLVDRVIRACGMEGDPIACWIGKHSDDVQRVIEMMDDMRGLPRQDYATVSVAVRSLDQLLVATKPT